MYIKGKVVDSQTGIGVPFVSVTVVDADGDYKGEGTAATNTGEFEFESYVLNSGGQLKFTSVGYMPVYIDPGLFLKTGEISLEKKSTELEPVTVTASRNIKGLWLGIGLILASKYIK